MSLTYAYAQQQYVYVASGGVVTEPLFGSWLAAFAVWQGATEPNGTWLQTICEQFGVTAPVNGSWVQALALYYNITDTIGYGNWWLAIADQATDPVDIWGTNITQWYNESETWALA